MASFTMGAVPWPAGTPVGAYAAQAWVNTQAQPSGGVLSSGVVTAAGTVSFAGLADQGRYVAWAAGTGIRFTLAPEGLQQPVAVPDRERIKALEERADSGGGTAGGGGGDVVVTMTGAEPSTAAGNLWIEVLGGGGIVAETAGNLAVTEPGDPDPLVSAFAAWIEVLA
jgi:hypothetical protein